MKNSHSRRRLTLICHKYVWFTAEQRNSWTPPQLTHPTLKSALLSTPPYSLPSFSLPHPTHPSYSDICPTLYITLFSIPLFSTPPYSLLFTAPSYLLYSPLQPLKGTSITRFLISVFWGHTVSLAQAYDLWPESVVPVPGPKEDL